MEIERPVKTVVAAVTADISTTQEVPMVPYAFGSLRIPAGSPITTLTFYGASGKGGDYVPLADVDVMAVEAGKGYSLADNCFGHGAIKILANAAGNVHMTLRG